MKAKKEVEIPICVCVHAILEESQIQYMNFYFSFSY